MTNDEFIAQLDQPATVDLLADACGARMEEIEDLHRRGVFQPDGTLRQWIRAYVTRLRNSAEDVVGRSLR